ncbi:MAG TPA: hypothetical protein VF228_17405 [Iamia sp.]
MARYAADTEVSSGRSRDEIERTLARYGADQFAYGWDGTRSMIQFRAHDRQVRFVLDMPDRHDPEFTETPTGKQRAEAAAEKAWEQAGRQRWRALALVVKAKRAMAMMVRTFSDAVEPNYGTEIPLEDVEPVVEDGQLVGWQDRRKGRASAVLFGHGSGLPVSKSLATPAASNGEVGVMGDEDWVTDEVIEHVISQAEAGQAAQAFGLFGARMADVGLDELPGPTLADLNAACDELAALLRERTPSTADIEGFQARWTETLGPGFVEWAGRQIAAGGEATPPH